MRHRTRRFTHSLERARCAFPWSDIWQADGQIVVDEVCMSRCISCIFSPWSLAGAMALDDDTCVGASLRWHGLGDVAAHHRPLIVAYGTMLSNSDSVHF